MDPVQRGIGAFNTCPLKISKQYRIGLVANTGLFAFRKFLLDFNLLVVIVGHHLMYSEHSIKQLTSFPAARHLRHQDLVGFANR